MGGGVGFRGVACLGGKCPGGTCPGGLSCHRCGSIPPHQVTGIYILVIKRFETILFSRQQI